MPASLTTASDKNITHGFRITISDLLKLDFLNIFRVARRDRAKDFIVLQGINALSVVYQKVIIRRENEA